MSELEEKQDFSIPPPPPPDLSFRPVSLEEVPTIQVIISPEEMLPVGEEVIPVGDPLPAFLETEDGPVETIEETDG
jgi:hypothetical protein